MIEKAGRNLIITLKCFEYSRGTESKVKAFPNIPLMLNLGHYVKKNILKRVSEGVDEHKNVLPAKQYLYELYGVVFHIGNSPTSGHYTACVKGVFDNYWYYCDDKVVNRVKHPFIVDPRQKQNTKQPFILFYRKIVNSVPLNTGLNYTLG